MNQTFNLHRFGLMLKLDLAEKGRNYLLMAILLVSLLLIMMLPLAFSTDRSNILEIMQVFALFMVVMLGSSLYTSTVFTQYAQPSTGIAALMVPASGTEKFLSALLINLAFIIPFITLFWQLHFYTIDFANSRLMSKYKYNHLPNDEMYYFTYCYFLIQGFVFLGSVYFRKASYVKTASVTLALFFMAAILQSSLAYYFTSNPGHIATFPLGGWKIWYSDSGYNFFDIKYPPGFQFVIYSFPFLLLLSLWAIAYLRLKEKEI